MQEVVAEKPVLRKWRFHKLLFSQEGHSHFSWQIKKFAADLSDRTGHSFTYIHPLLGRFVYHPSDVLSRRLLLYAEFEKAEIAYAIEIAKMGGLILDIGANIGVFSVACGRAAGSRGRVMAFEAGPRTFQKLQMTLERLNLPNVFPMQIAIGSQNGVTQFLESQKGDDIHQRVTIGPSCEGFKIVTVTLGTLNEVCGAETKDVSLLKIDIEGYEIRALMGASKILENGKANLIVEFYPKGLAEAGGTAEQLWQYLERTHCCKAVVRQDGTIRPPVLEEILSIHPQETCNSFWLPMPGGDA